MGAMSKGYAETVTILKILLGGQCLVANTLTAVIVAKDTRFSGGLAVALRAASLAALGNRGDACGTRADISASLAVTGGNKAEAHACSASVARISMRARTSE